MGLNKKPWQQIGEDPDYRFSFANERTYLAWIRTSLAITAGCVLLAEVTQSAKPFFHYLVIGLSLLAAMLSVMAYLQWKRSEIAMRLRQALPHNRALLLVLVMALVAAMASVMHLLGV
ncbi:MAG: YidH family protein [Comamonas sp.]